MFMGWGELCGPGYWATCKQKFCDGWYKITIKYMDLINQYFNRRKHNSLLPKQINPWNPLSVLNKISLVNFFLSS